MIHGICFMIWKEVMLEGKVILIVDDDPALLEMYTERLKAEGAIVLEAKDGEEAVAMVREDHPNLILLDIMMPKKNGFEVLRELSKDQDANNIPVIILSALADDLKKQEGMGAGAVDYVVKAETLPIDVIEKVRKVLAETENIGEI